MHQTGALVLKELIVFVRSLVPCVDQFAGRPLGNRLQVMGRSVRRRDASLASTTAGGLRMKHIAVPLLLVVGACMTPVGIVEPESLRIDIDDHVVDFNAARTFTMTGGPGEITVEGSLVTSQGGYTLTAAYSDDWETGYTLTILAELTSGGITVPIHHRYTVTLSGLPPGHYEWTIAHQIVDIETTPQVVWRQGVDVR